jgi:hypothetical protein
MEKLRGVDSGETAPAAHNVSGVDHQGNDLLPASSLTEGEKKLWLEMEAARFGDIRPNETEMSKILIEKDAKAYADGSRDQVGGFVSMQAHSDGLTSGEALQMAGLDSDWHNDVAKVFDKSTNQWTDNAAKTKGLDVLNFTATDAVYDQLQVPLGTDAKAIMQTEAARLQAAQSEPSTLGRREAIPELLQPKIDPVTNKPVTDAAGLPELPHITEMNRENTPMLDASGAAVGDSNPFTGWGFSSTRRAQDGLGNELPVIGNQELKMGNRVQIPANSELGILDPKADVESTYSLGGGAPVKKIEDDPIIVHPPDPASDRGPSSD